MVRGPVLLFYTFVFYKPQNFIPFESKSHVKIVFTG
jgi:hypothetical protein